MDKLVRSFLFGVYVIVAAGFMTSCNDDVFVDTKDLPDYREVTLDGDGGEWKTAFSRKGLTGIRFDYDHGDREHLRYFGVNGGPPVDADCPPSELGSIEYESPLEWYTIGFAGEMIYLRSMFNASVANRLRLSLDYDYGETKTIIFHITEGKRLQIAHVQYEGDMKTEENVDSITRVARITNNTSRPVRMEIMPYRDVNGGFVVVPESKWVSGMVLDMAVPIYTGESWEFRMHENVRIGSKDHLVPPYADQKFSVEVPADSKVSVKYTVRLSRASQEGKFYFINEVIEHYNYEENYTTTSVYPTGYVYSIEYE